MPTATLEKPAPQASRLRGSRPVEPIRWENGSLLALDQRLLPHRLLYRRLATPSAVAEAIRSMLLRGAPLIGCAAAYGYALGARGQAPGRSPDWPGLLKRFDRHAARLRSSRPTAVNLAHALSRMQAKARALAATGEKDPFGALAREADAIFREDLAANLHMARMGASLLPANATVITYCNAGALATSGIGTALGVIRWAWRMGKIRRVYACETRPYLQGSRLTLWELMRERIPATLITDNMAAHLMATERIDAVIVGADRIAANADTANKIGTYGLALAARHHRIPVYVVAPSTTVDLSLPDGRGIPIEERESREVLELLGRRIAPPGARARHPAFDVTPHPLIAAIVTERGIVQPATGARLRKVLAR